MFLAQKRRLSWAATSRVIATRTFFISVIGFASCHHGSPLANVEDRPVEMAEAIPTGQLPRDAVPLHYDLDLRIDPRSDEFEGSVSIEVEVHHRQEVIWMHGKDLSVQSVELLLENGVTLSAKYQQVDATGVVKLLLEQPIEPQKIRIQMKWKARYDQHLTGAYRTESDGRFYVYTQMQATYARQVFPGFDDPGFKTPFDIALTIPDGFIGIANSKLVSEGSVPLGDKIEFKRLEFATTEKMPTYLVAFAVGEFDVVEAPAIAPNAVRKNPLQLRGIATLGKGKQFEYLLTETPRYIHFLELYFDTPYPFDKLDLIAVPDFGPGAMENVGAITFREARSLIDLASTTEVGKRVTDDTLAHELAHMWLGDLVTMQWWDDTWLNEAFATWMAKHAVESVHPEDSPWVEFGDHVNGVMGEDSLLSARKVRQPIRNNGDISSAFDGITYVKGGAVLAMFENYMGEEKFRAGLRTYLQRHRHNNATVEDLMEALASESSPQLSLAFRTFLDQPGVPLLDLNLQCEPSRSKLIVHQSRFLTVGVNDDANRQWMVPMCFSYRDGNTTKVQCELINQKDEEIVIRSEQCPQWVFPNVENRGYYRWSLEAEDMATLRQHGLNNISVAEKLGFASSVEASFLNNRSTIEQILHQMAPLAQDKNHLVALRPMALIEMLMHMFSKPEARKVIADYGQKMFRPAYDRLFMLQKKGANELSGDDLIYYSQLLHFMAFDARDATLRNEFAKQGKAVIGWKVDYRFHPELVSIEQLGIVLGVSVQENGAPYFNALLKLLETVLEPRLRSAIISGLVRTTDPALVAQLQQLISGTVIRRNEVVDILRGLTHEPENQMPHYEWVKTHLETLFELLGSERAIFLPWSGSFQCRKEGAADVEKVFTPYFNTYPGIDLQMRASMESILACAAVAEAHETDAEKFFSIPPSFH